MPLFVTVTPGTTVTSSTTLDASTLNLLGTPNVDVTGTVDGGSLSITSGSVPLTALAAQNASTLVGNASGSSASPTALTSTDLAFATGTVNIGTGAVTTAKLADSSSSATGVTYAKIQHVTDARLIGRSAGTNGIPQEISVGVGLTLASGSLTSLRPRTAFTNVEAASTYTVSNNRSSAVEIAPLTTQITPQSNTSKVLVQFNFSGEIVYTSAFILERVDGATVTPLGVPSSPGSNRIYGTKVAPFDADDGSTQFNMAISFLDSPATTNTISYRIRVYCSAASAVFGLNRSISDEDQNFYMRATSQTILQEILPT
jgi:hypothetical protein